MNVNIMIVIVRIFMCLSAIFIIESLARKPKIIIIGAGVAGLSAASKLIENGFENVIILEAENRYGGRIYTAKFGKIMFDMGAKWCNRDVNDIVYKYAQPLGYLAPSEFNESLSKYYDSSGSEVSVNKMKNLFDNICKDKQTMSDYTGSIGDFFLDELEEKLQEEYVDIAEKDMYTEFYNKAVQCLVGADTWFDPTTESGRVICNRDHNLLWKEKGYTQILDFFIDHNINNGKNTTLKRKIHTYIKVNNIKIKDNHVLLGCNDVRTDKIKHYTADHVIVTIPLGVLKTEINTLFTPKLPEVNRRAINGIEFGKFSEIFMEYESIWWPEYFSGFNFLWKANKFTTLSKVFGRKYTDYKWLLEIKGLYPVVNNSKFLMVWIGGSESLQVDRLPKFILQKRITTLLRHFLGKKYTIPEPINIYRIKWSLNANFQGVYSYHSIRTKKMNITGEDLSQPLLNKYGKPVVHFAGEATSLYHYSTVHGAIETGWREANLISQLYK